MFKIIIAEADWTGKAMPFEVPLRKLYDRQMIGYGGYMTGVKMTILCSLTKEQQSMKVK